MSSHFENQGLYRRHYEHDSCGFGLLAELDGQPSHALVRTAVESLCRLTHRGAVAADGITGDGCGLLLAFPEAFLRGQAEAHGIALNGYFAAGTVFLSADVEAALRERELLQQALQEEGLQVAGWRTVPVDPTACGQRALQTLPHIEQLFVHIPEALAGAAAELHLYQARRRAERSLQGPGHERFYVCSLSARLVVYKALVMPGQLDTFYPDLRDPQLTTTLCLFHQRFSTNTWPAWRYAQPFRYLAHNGEINTIRGNRNWALARIAKFATPTFTDLERLMPLVSQHDSDSCSVDHMLEFLLAGRLDLVHALRLMIPPAWQNANRMDPDLRAYYHFNSLKMEPWDGPAGIVCTDGRIGVCILDRNGLRPARYVLTRNRRIVICSEVGVYDYAADTVLAKGRLRPGEMIAVDTGSGKLLLSPELDQQLQARRPCRRWLDAHATRLESAAPGDALIAEPMTPALLNSYSKLFLLSVEELEQIVRVLADQGQEAVGSMGDDTPLPVLSGRPRALYDNFRQAFAQVTNPPIDSLREQIVMSLVTRFGAEAAVFDDHAEQAARVEVASPVLSETRYRQLLARADLSHARLELHYDPGQQSLYEAIQALAAQAVQQVEGGTTVLVLTDFGISAQARTIPALLAVGAVHHRLIRHGLRCDANLLVETASARDPHHFAVLIGYGATAVHPYLAYQLLHDLQRRGVLPGTAQELGVNYRRGINKGLYKIMSKMGISTIASYRGAQLFEIVGLHAEIVELCFSGSPNHIQGMRFTHLEQDLQQLEALAWDREQPLDQGGLLKFIHGGEFHAYNPDVVHKLQLATQHDDYQYYLEYSAAVHARQPMVLRDLLQVCSDRQPIPISEVEPAEDIFKRFDTAGMSLGALSPTAHEALARAMNRIGGRSNSGEGGEAVSRYNSERNSAIKQVASGRFGVTPHYLVNAEVLQIKIAQGAKPGEGGQLPGHKVNQMIAELRHSSPGIALISPPPHHDIYSIEDLAQLIFDLKQVNPQALISVKLVALAGVGTVATGVAKAYADMITIAGYDGGTGASPLTSVKYAGSPWELGLTETQQVLRINGLRGKVRLQADGGLKTGQDVIKAAVLGAESFGFGTAPMISMGCKYLRICHLNNCATGVATQNPVLYQRHFKADAAERVVRYFHHVAKEVRETLAALGFCRLEELIGRVELLKVLPGVEERSRGLDLSALLATGGAPEAAHRSCQESRNEPFDRGVLAERMVQDALPAIAAERGGDFHYEICNYHRSIGARLSGEIARRYGDQGMNDAPIRLHLQGTAGQSLGVWNAGGLEICLQGDANDYVGKGMAGGKLVLKPPAESSFRSEQTVIMGNACLYGATGGRLFAAGVAGERFAVRNSGAIAILEGVGDHGCEYMTGGVVVILGETGINFGAGMTGGVALVLDHKNDLADRCNHDSVDLHRITLETMREHLDHLDALLRLYVRETDSMWGQEILQDFSGRARDFWLVRPKGAELATLIETLRAAA